MDILIVLFVPVALGWVIWICYSNSELGKQRIYYRKMLKYEKQKIKLTQKLKKIREDPDYKAWLKFQRETIYRPASLQKKDLFNFTTDTPIEEV